MKKKPLNRKLFVWRVMVLATGLATPGIAFAYLDPGTVSLLLQGLVGAIAAAGAAVALGWNNIKSFFRGLKRNGGYSEPKADPKSDDDPASK